ncbi:MAG: SAM-dependent methyltransferase [Streptomycetales bacterium]
MIDLDRPVGVLLVAILPFIRDEEDPAGIVARITERIAPGSYLIISGGTSTA